MPIENGRLVCCVCGADLGFSSDDPYADPDCEVCERRRLDEEMDFEREAEAEDEAD